MSRRKKRKPNYPFFIRLFLLFIACLIVLNYLITGYLQRFELKRTVKKNVNALVPIFFRKDNLKVSVYLDYEFPKYQQISSTRFLLSDRPGGQDFLDFYSTENDFLKKNPDMVRNGTEESGWVGTGWKTSEDKQLISGYSLRNDITTTTSMPQV